MLKAATSLSEVPGVSPSWQLIQTWRGLYNDATLYYARDVVYQVGRDSVWQVYILTAPQLQGVPPPNGQYWKPDQCSKRLSGCLLRHDPESLSKAIPFGAFPGTTKVPEA